MFVYVILLCVLQTCGAIIYDLNDSSFWQLVVTVVGSLSSLGCCTNGQARPDTEYYRMPPLFQLDDYDVCLHKFKSQYCLARWDLFADPSNNLITLIKGYSEYTTKHYNHTYIERGICVAKTCKSFIYKDNSNERHDINELLEACINSTMWNEYELQAKLAQIYYCDELKEEEKYDRSDYWFGAILLAIVAINLIGSLFEIIIHQGYFTNKKNVIENKNGMSFLLCFSMFSNWKYMTSTEPKDPRYNILRGLHGVRALTSFLMPLAHVMWLVGCGYTDNPREVEKASESIHYQLIFNGMTIVQIFFTVSGFLMVYSLQVYSENAVLTWSQLPHLITYRWFRLTPMNALMIAFTATWLRYIGYGPLWNQYVTSVAAGCRRFWWAHILYFNNYIPEDDVCAVQTWHLATEIQLFILGLIIYMAIKYVRKSIPLALLLLLSMAAPALHVWFQDLDAIVIIRPEFYRSFSNDTYRYMHVLGHNNLSSFVIGMITGYIAYHWLKNGINVFRHKLWRCLAWCVVPAVVGLFLTGNIFYEGERPSVIVRMAYAAVQRSAVGVLTAFMVLSLVMRVEDFQRRILEWHGWVVPSRLSYCAFLLHIDIVHAMLGARTQLAHVSFLYVVINHLGIVTLSYLLAVPCYLMVEAPFTQLNKAIFEKKLTPPTKKTI